MEDFLEAELKAEVINANALEDSQQVQQVSQLPKDLQVSASSESEETEEDLSILEAELKAEVINANALEDSQQVQKPAQVEVPVEAPNDIVNGAAVQDGELENKLDDSQPQLATIKIESKPVDGTKQNDSMSLAPEDNGDKSDLLKEDESNAVEGSIHEKEIEKPAMIDMRKSNPESQGLVGNNFQKQAQGDTKNLQGKTKSYNDKAKALKSISKRLKKQIVKLGEVEKNENALIRNAANPQNLSDDFRAKYKGRGLGLETVASRYGDSIKFNIIGTKDREDLTAFIGLTVSISGLENNEALVDFVSAVRVVGFEKAVKYMNSDEVKNQYKKQYNLPDIKNIELTLFDKNGNKIEDEEKLKAFKKATVPTNNSLTIKSNMKKVEKAGFEYKDIEYRDIVEDNKESVKTKWVQKILQKTVQKYKGYVYDEDGKLVKTRINRTVSSDAGMIRG